MKLEVRDLYTSYGLSQILFGVSLEVAEGEGVCLLGRNGVGKTTTLRSIVGLTPPRRGRVTFDGTDITGWPPFRVARRGIGFVPQERRIFADLSVRENLEVAAGPRSGRAGRWSACTRRSRSSPDSTAGAPAISREASSRCSPWAGPSWAIRACSSWTSPRRDSPRSWWRRWPTRSPR